MIKRAADKTAVSGARQFAVYLALVLVLTVLVAIACGVESGERRPSRAPGTKETAGGGFHRSPVTAFEQFRINLAKTDEGCTADPADVTVSLGQRVRLAIQLPAEIVQGTTRSLEVVGEKVEVTYAIRGLEISAGGGAFPPGIKEFNLTMESGARQSYDFNPVTVGAFDILCDDVKVGTFTLTEG